MLRKESEILKLLKEIKELLDNKDDALLRQEIMDKLNAIKADLEATIA